MLSVLKINTGKISFGRAPVGAEVGECTQTCKEAKDYLGIKHLTLGIHRTSYPVSQGDLFVGSNISQSAVELDKFINMLGFDSKQDGPPGLISKKDPSPYGSTIFSKSYLNADMKKLATDKYSNILNLSDILEKSSIGYIETSDMTNFESAFESYDSLFEKAYDNLHSRTDLGSQRLKEEFSQFKNTAGQWLDSDAKFDAKNERDVDLYKFKQFITAKQEREFALENPHRLNIFSDAIVGFSEREVKAYPEAFLKDYRIGAPGGGSGMAGQPAHQAWDLPVINPKTIFNEDGTLGVGGKLLKAKFSSLLENAQNIRIDHVLGLVDPWIYDKNNLQVIKNEAGEIVSTNAHGAFLSEMNWDNSIDPKHNYERILEDIIMPVLKEKGINVQDVVYETLGDQTNTFKKVFFDKLNLPEMRDLRWQRGENLPRNGWLSITTHDNEPFTKLVQQKIDDSKDYFKSNKNGFLNPEYLIGFLHPEKTNEQRAKLMKNLEWDARLRYNTKYSELLRCGEKVQIFFTDLFGISKTYNHSGTRNADNWKLRLPKNYQQDFYKRLENQDWKNIALNMPEIFKRAVISKIFTAPTSRQEQEKEFARMKPLIEKLEKFEKILYEPEKEIVHHANQILENIDVGQIIKKIA